MHFTSAQSQAIQLSGSLVVTAGAGSGKTRVLVERYLRLLTECSPLPDNAHAHAASLLAITFTEKAAREMRNRVRTTIEDRTRHALPDERQLWETWRSAVESARIGTIHSFCANLLRDHAVETGIDPRFTVLDEVDSVLLMTESVDSVLSNTVQNHTNTPHPVLNEFGLHELRDMLIQMLQAGSEVRLALQQIPATAEELEQQWQEQLQHGQTFAKQDLLASLAWRQAAASIQQLATLAPADDRVGSQIIRFAPWLTHDPTLADLDAANVMLASINLQGGSARKWSSAANLRDAKDALKALRLAYQEASTLLQWQADTDLEQRVAQTILDLKAIYLATETDYTRCKTARDMLDFDDLEARTMYLFKQYPHVCQRWQAELQVLMVDEFQDTNEQQRGIIYALAGMTQSAIASASSHATLPCLFIVGDGKQSIYRFRGADVSVFRQVQSDMLNRGKTPVVLDTSFRTHPALLGWINTVSEGLFARSRELYPYEMPFEPLQAHRPAAHGECWIELHLLDPRGFHVVSENPSEETESDPNQADTSQQALHRWEANIIAQRIKALVAGEAGPVVYDHQQRTWRIPDYGDIALLFQASTVFEYYEQALAAAQIPYLTTAGRGYYGRKEVQDLLHLLRVLHDPDDELALVGVLRSPLFALDDATLLHLRLANPERLWSALMQAESLDLPATSRAALDLARATLYDLSQRRGRRTVVELLREALNTTGYLATISGLANGERRRANVEKLLSATRQSRHTSLNAFSRYLEHVLRIEPREGESPLEAEGSVRLMTIHRSKGLEFPIVVLSNLSRRAHHRLPHWLAQRGLGLALQLRNRYGQWQDPLVFTLAREQEKQMEQAEHERLLYVALTRVRDYLVLSGTVAQQSKQDWLSRMVQVQGWAWEQGGPPPGSHGPVFVRYHSVAAES